MCYSVQPRDRIFVKRQRVFSFAKNMNKNIGKNISKLVDISSKYSQKFLDHAEQLATDALKAASKRAIQKTAGITGDLVRNKITDKITKISKTSKQDYSETVSNEDDKEIPKERYASPEEIQKIIDDLRLI